MDLAKNLNKNVFFSSFLLILAITASGSLFPKRLGVFFDNVQSWLITNTSWIYVLAVGTILILSIYLMVGRLGDIKLGPDHSEPEFTNFSWFTMLFSAGMGIGLLFFGVAEPMMHFSSPPIGTPSSIDSAREAMKITFFHWGLHAWAVYAILAVTLSYFSYRKNLPLLPRSAFYPLIGEKVFGPIGDLIDTLAVIGTMFGVATSLGFGVSQVNAGLNYLFEVPQSPEIQVLLICIITAFATISVVLGLDGGIKKLSNLNIAIACGLLITILLLGNTVDLMQAFVQNTGAYISDLTHKTFNLFAYDKKEKWIGGWTLLYWGWWISWSPFVGMFIAKISRGRTIREFMLGVLFIPTGFTFLWMTVFGNSAIAFSLEGRAAELMAAVNTNVPVALFKFFEFFPFSSLLSIVGLLLVITFFVSSSDSGSLVIDTLTSGGAEHPPVWQRVFWAVTEGVVAAVLLLAGGLDSLQTMTIASAFPMIFLIIIGAFSLVKSLRDDYLLLNSVQNHTTTIQYAKANTTWRERLDSLVAHPQFKEVRSFLNTTAKKAFKELTEEMVKRGLEAEWQFKARTSVALVVKNGDDMDFIYEIRLRSFDVPEYAPEDNSEYCRAEVFLASGGQDYDVFGYTSDQIIADAITQFEKHFHFLHMTNT